MPHIRAATPHDPYPGVDVSEELLAPTAPVELCYQTFGDRGAEPLLLVMGLTAPMTWWDDSLCLELAGNGFHVVRFDNRDVGRSSRLDQRVGRLQVLRAFGGAGGRIPYGLEDMAADGFALLDHLDLGTAHVVGASMGGMIAQTMAIGSPDRVRSLTSIMSTTGRRTVGWQNPSLLPRLIAPRRAGREPYVAHSVAFAELIGSPGYPTPAAEQRERAAQTWDRAGADGVDPQAALRQMLAILTQPDRTAQLKALRMPALVVHGLADQLVHPSGGRATAQAIPGAELLMIEGMGHDLPRALHHDLVDAITRTAARG